MRVEWIDKAKGIGILLVILGHTFCPESISFWLYSFHIPLFFFLSGYVFKIKTLNFPTFVKNKITSLLIPAFFMEIIIIIYSYVESLIFNTNYSINLLSRILGIFIQRRGGVLSFGPWFLICLFTVQILMYFLLKYFRSDLKLLSVGVICSLLGYAYCSLIGIILPWTVDVSLIAILFFIIGYLIKKNEFKFETLFKLKYLWTYAFISLSITFIQYFQGFTKIDMYANKYSEYVFFIIGSLSGILIIITLVKNLSLVGELIHIGKSSLVYYSLHGLILSTITLILKQSVSIEYIEKYYYLFGILNVFEPVKLSV